MKIFMVFVLAFFCAIAISFNAIASEHSESELKVLKDAAAALKVSNPNLSTELTRFADLEEKEFKAGKHNEVIADELTYIKVLKDSAAALKTSNATLSADLNKYADKEEKEHAQEKMNILKGK